MATERNSGLRSILARPWVYNAFQKAVGSGASRNWISTHHVRAESGMTIVDIGCGTGEWRSKLPEAIDYFGYDLSADCIAAAKGRHKGDFLAGTMKDFMAVHG